MKRKKSFTLIEVLVVIGAISIILPSLFAIIFALLREQIKLYQLSEVKRQGDYALSVMESTIRNYGSHIYDDPTNTATERCQTVTNSDTNVVYFTDTSNYWFQYVLSGGSIASQSEIASAVNLTGSRVTVSNLSITCQRTASVSVPIVTVKFTVSAGNGSSRQEERANLNYQTRIKLKNY